MGKAWHNFYCISELIFIGLFLLCVIFDQEIRLMIVSGIMAIYAHLHMKDNEKD